MFQGDVVMKVPVKTRRYSSEEIKRELEASLASEKKYFDLMYQTLQFSFAAIIAVAGFAFAFFDENANEMNYCSLLFSYVLPGCLYVFGIMYAYNAYALAICGKKTETLHQKLYANKASNDPDFDSMMKKHVISNRLITLLAYGVPLGCFLVVPIASIAFSCVIYNMEDSMFFYHILPALILCLYLFLMLILIVAIAKDHFAIDKLQKK